MATRPHTITDDDVAKGLQLYNLLKVCHGAAERLSDQLERDSATQNLAGALPGAIDQAIEKFWEVQNAIETAHTSSVLAETPAAKPNRPAGSTIRDLCHQWEVVEARLNLDILESTGGDKESDRILDEARAQFRAIEQAILATDPDAIRDVDLVVMLRLARKVIGDDQFIPEQEERFKEMYELADTALVRRTEGADWNMEAQS